MMVKGEELHNLFEPTFSSNSGKIIARLKKSLFAAIAGFFPPKFSCLAQFAAFTFALSTHIVHNQAGLSDCGEVETHHIFPQSFFS